MSILPIIILGHAVICDLEQGVAPWTKPWKMDRVPNIHVMPANAKSHRPYSGANVLILWGTAYERGYPTHGWLTYRQANEAGGSVRRGEKGTHIVYTKLLEPEEEGGEKKRVLRAYTVFNVAQCEGLDESIWTETDDTPEDERLGDIADFIHECGVPITIGGDMAAYYPAKDQIVMPPKEAFDSLEHFYATELHELTHATGHASRLNRDTLTNAKSGSDEYAKEELVAEMGAAFLCAHLGIKGDLKHSEYIDHWLKVLKADQRAIFYAASRASQAADFWREHVNHTAQEAA